MLRISARKHKKASPTLDIGEASLPFWHGYYQARDYTVTWPTRF